MLKNKSFYFEIIASFAVIVLLDWFINSGFKLFQGAPFSQTIEHYKIPFVFLGVSVAIAYSKYSKLEKK